MQEVVLKSCNVKQKEDEHSNTNSFNEIQKQEL